MAQTTATSPSGEYGHRRILTIRITLTLLLSSNILLARAYPLGCDDCGLVQSQLRTIMGRMKTGMFTDGDRKLLLFCLLRGVDVSACRPPIGSEPAPESDVTFEADVTSNSRPGDCDAKCAELSLKDRLVCLVRECGSELDDVVVEDGDVATCLQKECRSLQDLERTVCLLSRCGEASEMRKRRWGDVVSMCIASHCGGVTGSLRMDCIVKKCHKHRRSI